MLVSTPREALWAWVNTRLRLPWSEDFRAIGIVRNDCLVGAVAYNGFVGRACFMHGAIDDTTAVTRTFREEILAYPFRDLQLECVMGLVDSTNHRQIKMARGLGFKQVDVFKGSGTGGCDLVMFRLYREEWKADYELRRSKRTENSRLHRGSERTVARVDRPSESANVGQPAGHLHPMGVVHLERNDVDGPDYGKADDVVEQPDPT